MTQLFFLSLLLITQVCTHAFAASYEDVLVEQASTRKLSQQKQWLKLLHYRKRTFGGYKSEADGMGFFNSPQGRTNPEAELEATIRAFFSTKDYLGDEQHPQCKYPARFLWLSRELGFDPKQLAVQKCPRFERFHENVNAHSATVVFSSYYLNNPASAFGHSLLRLNRANSAQAGRRYELLDYGIGYAASVTISNPLIYGVYGVLGLFPGNFTSIPYYYKVREYNDYESRDLWEYDLNLTAAQSDMMVAHVWELGSTYFDYYYLSENCAYHVLSIIEAGNPELELLDKLPSVVIPHDTIRALMKTPGLVTKVHYRPSVRVQFQHRLSGLTPEQKDLLQSLLDSKKLGVMPANYTAQSRVAVLDTAIDYMDYKYGDQMGSPDTSAAQWKQQLLMARAQVGIPSAELKIEAPEKDKPHQGHDSARVGLQYGYSDQTGSQARLNFRLALHDILDPVPGYPDYAQIEFFNTQLRYNTEPKTLKIDDFSLIRVLSLSRLTKFNRQPSWKVKLGARNTRDITCPDCTAANGAAGVGYTISPFEGSPLDLIAMVEGESLISTAFEPFVIRTGFGPSLMARVRFSDRIAALAYGLYKYQFPNHSPHTYEYGGEARAAFSKNMSVGLKAVKFPVAWEYSSGLYYYF